MANDTMEGSSLLTRTYTKAEILDRAKFIRLENSEIPANEIDIERAIDRAIQEMRAEMESSVNRTE